MEKTSLSLIELLSKSPAGLTSEMAAIQLGVSSKTIRRYVTELNQQREETGCWIEGKKGRGLSLQITNQEKFLKVQEQTRQKEDLLEQLIEFFIAQEDYVKAETICTHLFISQSKLSAELKNFRRILSYYQLTLEAKPYYGMKIAGSEFDLRRFLASNYVQKYHLKMRDDTVSLFGETASELFELIKEIISEEFAKQAYPISENILNNLTYHLQIAVTRMQEGCYLEQSIPVKGRTNSEQELLGQRIIDRLEEACEVQFSESEHNYVLGQIVGKRIAVSEESQVVSKEVNELVNEILLEIKEQKHLDLLHDLELQTMLNIHCAPLIDRLHLGIELKNPLLDQVKIHCVMGYDLAIIAGQTIYRKYQQRVSDHELSYLAMHFDVSLNREANSIAKKQILVINELGRSTGELLKVKFGKYFHHHIDSITICEQRDYEEYLQNNDYDFIFTTTPVDYRGSIPIFDFEYFLQPATVQKIEKVLAAEVSAAQLYSYFSEELYFTNKQFGSRKELLAFLSKEARKKLALPENFEALVEERENYFGTDLLPNAAFPHPNALISPKTMVCVLTLKKPIFWYKHSVRIVFLVLINKKDHLKSKPLTEHLIHLCSSPVKMQQMIQAENFEEFMSVIKE
ncbi:PRD domain protein [Enterococcus sp. JM4C]|uniref:BglG family transcription antiterminator n=1 Tax=Candidatus Enterococcus huntleyi TaxID=1857217 RepID=UPI001379557A|nr:PRD domain-containing protein [Enterococcus sp. JM4C]KAF1298854.1 PRD domain protein [Enterococcus sp. JM4C]